MPVPSAITDLSTTASSNSPAGSDNVFPDLDNYLRAQASFIALLRDGRGLSTEVSVASATTTDIGGASSMQVQITGTTTITSFGTNYLPRILRFAGALTLTHNATTLILPTGANLTTAAGDMCLVVPVGTSGWRVMQYQRAANGSAPYLAASGASTTTIQAKLQESVSVKDFGAVGNGVTDDSAAVQAAVNALSSGGTLSFPFGTYKLNTSILIATSNLNIVGNGSTIDATTLAYDAAVRGSGAVFRFVSPNPIYNTTLTATSNAGTFTLTFASATNAAAGQLVRCRSTEVQYRDTAQLAYYNDMNKIVGVLGTTITLESPLQYPLTVSPYAVNVVHSRPISNIIVDGFTMLGGGVRATPLGNSAGPCGIWGSFVENITVKNCRIYGFQGIAVGIEFVQEFVVSDCFFEGVDATTVITEGQNSGFYGAYAIYARRVLFTRCIGQRMRRVFDALQCYQITQADSVANNTWRAAFGTHDECYDFNCVNNVTYSCYSGVSLRALTANVVGNTFTAGSQNNPRWVGFTTGLGITGGLQYYGDPGQARYNISNNRIFSYGSGTGAFAGTGSYDQLTITNNLFVGGAPGIQFNNADQNLNSVFISGNSFFFDGTGTNTSAISTVQSKNGTINNLVIANNISQGHSVNIVSIEGCTDVQAPANNIKILDNTGVAAPGSNGNGIILRSNGGYYGDKIVIRGNSQWGVTAAVETVRVCQGQTYRLRGFPVVELNDQEVKTDQGNRAIAYASSATPTALDGATLFRGSVIENTAPAAGSPDRWVVTTVGTNGTIAGVTGNITAGTNTLALTGNDDTKVYAGSYIAVAGSGLTRVRVDSIDAAFAVATLSSNASTTVVGAAVTRANPVISAGANLV